MSFTEPSVKFAVRFALRFVGEKNGRPHKIVQHRTPFYSCALFGKKLLPNYHAS
ncbi:MAG: hypothetical protein R3E67_07120 [Pseudomonadales bacterium]